MTCPPINICQLSFCTSNAFCNNCAVMVSATPCGTLLHSMVIHASASRFLACVNREWLQVVRAVICELRRGFLGSSFHVPCFEGLSLTGLIVMPVFACADKADYLVSAGCTITVKFNAKDEILYTGFAFLGMFFEL